MSPHILFIDPIYQRICWSEKDSTGKAWVRTPRCIKNVRAPKRGPLPIPRVDVRILRPRITAARLQCARTRTRTGPGTRKRNHITRRSPRRDNEAEPAGNGVPVQLKLVDTHYAFQDRSSTGGYTVVGPERSLSYVELEWRSGLKIKTKEICWYILR